MDREDGQILASYNHAAAQARADAEQRAGDHRHADYHERMREEYGHDVECSRAWDASCTIGT